MRHARRTTAGGLRRLGRRLLVVAVVGVAVFAVTRLRHHERGVAARPVVSAAVVDPFTRCGTCHKDFDGFATGGRLADLTFRHDKHFTTGMADCISCHAVDTHPPGVAKPTLASTKVPSMLQCAMCHGVEADARAPGRCETCHVPGVARRPTTHDAPTWAKGGHGAAARAGTFECRLCHTEATCETCHGLPIPHPSDWRRSLHARTALDRGFAACTNCHDRRADRRDACDGCHHVDGNKDLPWTQVHSTVVRDKGARTCFTCHAPDTCSRCHEGQGESFDADRVNLKDEGDRSR